MPDYIWGILIVIGLIVLFVVAYILNKRTPKPEGCQLDSACKGCPITSCLKNEPIEEEKVNELD